MLIIGGSSLDAEELDGLWFDLNLYFKGTLWESNFDLVIFTLEVGIAILNEASLSFLGVGIQPPTPSWGLLIAEGKEAIFFQPWLIILPGIALFTLVVSINMLGDGLRDISDPNSKVSEEWVSF